MKDSRIIIYIYIHMYIYIMRPLILTHESTENRMDSPCRSQESHARWEQDHAAALYRCGWRNLRDLLPGWRRFICLGWREIVHMFTLWSKTVCYWTWPFSSLIYPLKMVILHSYVSSPKGKWPGWEYIIYCIWSVWAANAIWCTMVCV